MAKTRSYIDIASLPLDQLSQGISLSSVLRSAKCGDISEADKHDVIVLKEAFVLLDQVSRRAGVFTRSDRDHGSKIGDCSMLLCGNFDKTECTVTQDGMIIYDVKDRLHTYMKEISGLFVESRSRTIPTIYYHDKNREKRYLFLLFELHCDFREMPLCYRLDNRQEDMFIGMRDMPDVVRGLAKYNKGSFDVDRSLVQTLPGRKGFFPGTRRFTVADKLIEAKLASFTLVKFNLIGL